jgi:hypothetical protein
MHEAEEAWIAADFPGDAETIETIVASAAASTRPM